MSTYLRDTTLGILGYVHSRFDCDYPMNSEDFALQEVVPEEPGITE